MQHNGREVPVLCLSPLSEDAPCALQTAADPSSRKGVNAQHQLLNKTKALLPQGDSAPLWWYIFSVTRGQELVNLQGVRKSLCKVIFITGNIGPYNAQY